MKNSVVGVSDVIERHKVQHSSLPDEFSYAFEANNVSIAREEFAELQVINREVSGSCERLMKSNEKMLKLTLLLIAKKRASKSS